MKHDFALPGILLLLFTGLRLLQIQTLTEIAFILFVGGLYLLFRFTPLPVINTPSSENPPFFTWKYWRLGSGILLICIGAMLSFGAYDLFSSLENFSTPIENLIWNRLLWSLVLWSSGILLLAHHPPVSFQRPGLTVLLFSVILGLATFLRIYRLDTVPFGIWIDEAVAGNDARFWLIDMRGRRLFYLITNITGLHVALYAFVLDIQDSGITSMRLVTASFGIGAVILSYLVGNLIFNRWFGLLMAFFMATFHWSINFSRLAMTGIDTPFFILLSFYFVVRMTRYQQLRDALFLGLSVGTGLWFYGAFRIVPLALGVYWVLAWRCWNWRPLLLSGIAILTAWMVAFPVYLLATNISPDIFRQRYENITIFNEENRQGEDLNTLLLESTEKHLLMFHVEGDYNPRHNLPGDPMLDPLTGLLLIAGAGALIRYFPQTGAATVFFLLIFIIGLFGGISTNTLEAPHAGRTTGVLPALAYSCAAGTLALFQVARQTRYRQYIIPAMAILLIGFVPCYNYQKYFEKQAAHQRVWQNHSTMEALIARQNDNADYHIFITPLLSQHPTILFLNPSARQWHTLDATFPVPLVTPADKPVRIFLLPADEVWLTQITDLYSSAEIHRVIPADYGYNSTELMFYRIDIPAEDIARPQGLNQGGTGVLYIPETGYYHFSADESFILDGAYIENHTAVWLARGNHMLQLYGNSESLRWLPPESLTYTAVPHHMLYRSPVTAGGFHGLFYPNAQWAGGAAVERIDVMLDTYFHITPLIRPYSANWSGYLNISKTGIYKFRLRATSEAELYLNSELILKSDNGEVFQQAEIELTPGQYELIVRYRDLENYPRIHLHWSSPDSDEYAPLSAPDMTPVRLQLE